jgi:hypothetical protein
MALETKGFSNDRRPFECSLVLSWDFPKSSLKEFSELDQAHTSVVTHKVVLLGK